MTMTEHRGERCSVKRIGAPAPDGGSRPGPDSVSGVGVASVVEARDELVRPAVAAEDPEDPHRRPVAPLRADRSECRSRLDEARGGELVRRGEHVPPSLELSGAPTLVEELVLDDLETLALVLELLLEGTELEIAHPLDLDLLEELELDLRGALRELGERDFLAERDRLARRSGIPPDDREPG